MIRADDRISAVLKQDEALIDVFASLSPAFERLRNPGMRKVMTRLVTVRQAALIGGVDVDTLLARLNGFTHADRMHANAHEDFEAATGKPAPLNAIAPEDIVTADVRDDLRAGREPFSTIMAALRSVPEGGALCVRAIFEPVPLYAVMQRQGLAYHAECYADDDWAVWFYPEPAAASNEATEFAHAPARAGDNDNVVLLDVRGLEPPEPMVRTLAALEQLPEGATLVQINVRVPQFLLPLLTERGFTYDIREQDDIVRLFISRDNAAH